MKSPKKTLKKTVAARNREIFDSLAAKYDHPLIQLWMKRFHRPVFAEVGADGKKRVRGMKILDVSCGTGELLGELSRRGNFRLNGVDLSGKMLRIARHKLGRKALLGMADVNSLPFKSNTFDYVISTEAFHHYPHQQEALREMARVARVGGRVLIVDLDFGLRVLNRFLTLIEPGCVKVNSKKDMLNLFAGAGLGQVRQKRSFGVTVMSLGVKP